MSVFDHDYLKIMQQKIYYVAGDETAALRCWLRTYHWHAEAPNTMVLIPLSISPTLPGFPSNFSAPLPPATPGRAGSGGATAESSDIWSSILDSVSNRRGVVTKNLIVLGESFPPRLLLSCTLSRPCESWRCCSRFALLICRLCELI